MNLNRFEMGLDWFESVWMGLNGFSQDPVQAPMSLSCCSAFEWLSPLGLGSGMRCEESNSTGTEQLRLHLATFALLLATRKRTQKCPFKMSFSLMSQMG